MERISSIVEEMKKTGPNVMIPSTIKDWFLHHGIRVLDDPERDSLYFCLADVARVIGDENARRYKSKHLTKAILTDAKNHARVCRIISEIGLYQYLLQSKRPVAEPFQEFVYEILVGLRKAAVTMAEKETHLAQQDLAVAIENINVRDRNFRVLVNDNGCRLDYPSELNDTICERCFRCGVDISRLTHKQIRLLRDELHMNEAGIIDPILERWKRTDASL